MAYVTIKPVMNTRSIIVGIIAVVIIAAIGWTVAKRLPKISLPETIKSRFSNTEKVSPTPTGMPGTFGGGTVSSGNGTEMNLNSCTDEILTQNCADVEKQAVCGYEQVAGRDSSRSLDYISACHYCSLYGSDGILDMGDYQVRGLGYTEGSCN